MYISIIKRFVALLLSPFFPDFLGNNDFVTILTRKLCHTISAGCGELELVEKLFDLLAIRGPDKSPGQHFLR